MRHSLVMSKEHLVEADDSLVSLKRRDNDNSSVQLAETPIKASIERLTVGGTN